MTVREVITAIIIHLIVPVIGLCIYWNIYRKIKREKIVDPPIIELFVLFVTYGGLLIVCLTSMFWMWSGAASLGTFYLILGAPILMIMIAIRNRQKRSISKYHKWTFLMSIFYLGIGPLALAGLYLVIDQLKKA